MRRLKMLALAALFAAGVCQGLRFRPGDRAIYADDQLYFFVAERAASGVPPHVSLVDHKHQLAPLISAVAIAIGRVFGADDVLAGRVPSLLLAAAVVPMLCMLGESLTGSFAAGVAAAACALTLKMFFVEAATGFRTQLFMTFFAVAALLAYARGLRAGAGALAACAFLCWQPAVVIGGALVAASLFEARRASSVRRVVAGGVAVLLAYEAYFALNGALGEQLYQSYLMGKGLRIPPFTNTLRFLLRGDPSEGGWWRPDAFFAGVLLAAMAATWLWALVRPRAAWAAWKSRAAWRAVFVGAHGAVAFTFLDHQAYPDRFFVLPYVALMAACLVAAVPERVARLPMRTAASLLVCACIVSFVPNLIHASNLSGGALDDQRSMARLLVEISDRRGGGLWVVGRPDLLAFEHRTNWDGFGMLLDEHVREYAQRKSHARGAYRPVRSGKMPELVLVARVSARKHLPWLFKEYDRVDIDEFASLHGGVFVKKSKLLSRPGPTFPGECGDPIGDRFAFGGLDVGRPPTATDALYLLRAVLEHKPCQPCVCDIDGSGDADVIDALRLLKIASGENLEMRCPKCKPGPNQRLFEAAQRTTPRPPVQHAPSRPRTTRRPARTPVR